MTVHSNFGFKDHTEKTEGTEEGSVSPPFPPCDAILLRNLRMHSQSAETV
jgi:hypothetical protein